MNFGRIFPIFCSFSADFPPNMYPILIIYINGICAEFVQKNSSMVPHLPLFRPHVPPIFCLCSAQFPHIFCLTFCSFCAGPILRDMPTLSTQSFSRETNTREAREGLHAGGKPTSEGFHYNVLVIIILWGSHWGAHFLRGFSTSNMETLENVYDSQTGESIF